WLPPYGVQPASPPIAPRHSGYRAAEYTCDINRPDVPAHACAERWSYYALTDSGWIPYAEEYPSQSGYAQIVPDTGWFQVDDRNEDPCGLRSDCIAGDKALKKAKKAVKKAQGGKALKKAKKKLKKAKENVCA